MFDSLLGPLMVGREQTGQGDDGNRARNCEKRVLWIKFKRMMGRLPNMYKASAGRS